MAAPDEATGFVLFTGALSERNIRIYKKAGYRLLGPDPARPGRRTAHQGAAPLGVDEAVEGHARGRRRAARPAR